MTGVNFEIRKLMAKQKYIDDFKEGFFAGLLSSGPWLVSVLGMGMLWLFSYPYFGLESQKLFRVVIVYTFAYSLILTGLIQFVLTRFLSDKLFLKQKDMFLPAYIAVLVTTMAASGTAAAVFYSLCEVDLVFKLVGAVLFVTVCCIWQTMIFLGASRDFMAVISAFFWGNALGVVLANVLAPQLGFNGYLLGYAAAQMMILFFLMYRIFRGFDPAITCSFEFLTFTGKYFDLLLIGLFYYAAIWIDKILYWYSPFGTQNKSLFFSQYPYDSCMFLAFMTIVPAAAHFIADVETTFRDAYKGFYGSLVNRAPLREIEKEKDRMVRVMKEASSRMIMLQAVITGAFLCYSPQVIAFLKLPGDHLPVVWAAGAGSFFHVLVLLSLIFMLYFDRRKAAFFLAAFFFLTNTIFTLAVIYFFPGLMGLGYAGSAFISAVFGAGLLISNVRNMEYRMLTERQITKTWTGGVDVGWERKKKA